jgi:hypothetical protein
VGLVAYAIGDIAEVDIRQNERAQQMLLRAVDAIPL